MGERTVEEPPGDARPAGADADGPLLDVDALVRELRLEAEELRARFGASRLPPAESQAEALGALGAQEAPSVEESGRDPVEVGLSGSVKAAVLSALADPGDAAIHSHRARLGRTVVAAKNLLRRLLTPILDRQGAFNRATIEALVALEADASAQLGTLAQRLLALEAEVERLAGWGPHEDAGFDYGAFEDAFRGSRDRVRRSQSSYVGYFAGPESGPVLDLGCGRGEFLELLRAAGVPAWGVERDAVLVERGRALGLDVRRGDLLGALESVADGSLGGVVTFQVVEHLPLWKLLRLIALARAKLRPGGWMIAETVNVGSLVTFARGWSLDPTHRHPLHPAVLQLLMEQVGFECVEVVFSGEVDAASRLEEGEEGDREARNARRLNALLFAPQDYAIVARA